MTGLPPIQQVTLVHRLRELLTDQGSVREVRMFGGVAFMIDERMAVSVGRDGDLLVRIHPDNFDDLLRRGAVEAWMGAGRSMGRSWVSVPGARIEDDAILAQWLRIGIDSRTPPN